MCSSSRGVAGSKTRAPSSEAWARESPEVWGRIEVILNRARLETGVHPLQLAFAPGGSCTGSTSSTSRPDFLKALLLLPAMHRMHASATTRCRLATLAIPVTAMQGRLAACCSECKLPGCPISQQQPYSKPNSLGQPCRAQGLLLRRGLPQTVPPPTSSSGTHAGPLMLVEATLDNWCGRRHHPIAKGQSIQPNVMSCRCLRVGSCCRFTHGSHSSRCLCAGSCCCFSHSPHSSSCLQHIGKFASVCQAVVAPAAAVPWGHKPSHPPPLQGCTIQRGSPAGCRCGAKQN